MTPGGLDLLVDPRFGPITRVVRQPAQQRAPAGFVAYSAEVADTRAFAPWRADPYAFGASLTDPRQARLAALGEAVERYCANAVPPGLVAATYRQLAAAGTAALDPADLVLYSDEQYRTPGFPFRRLDADLRVRWVEGWDLATGDALLVPASLVYVNFHLGRYADEPRTNAAIMPGLATGVDRAAAARSALAEVVERDAVTLWWQRGQGATGVDTEPDGFPTTLLAGPDATVGLDCHLVRIPSDLGVPVLAALVDDQTLGVVSMGAACDPRPRVAATKALTEAVQLRAFGVELLDPRSRVWRGIRDGHRPANIVRAFRADRSYLDTAGPDFRHAVDIATHAQLYLDPRMRRYLAPLLHPRHRAPLPPPSEVDLLDVLRHGGRRAVAVELTTPDIAACGLAVVRVLVPGLYPNAPAAFPFLGGDRLYRVPDGVDGTGTRWLRSTDIVRAPLPGL